MKFNEKSFAAWEKKREKGLFYYMAFNGGLLFGLPCGIAIILYMLFIKNSTASWLPLFVLCILWGIFTAWPTWILNEKSREAYFADHGEELQSLEI